MTCPHCSATTVKTILRFEQQATFRCYECRGFFNHPSVHTDRMYDRGYYERNYLPRRENQLREARECLALLRRFAPSGSILDYGCGAGVFLHAAHAAGYTDNVGADVSRDALQIAKEQVVGSSLVHLPSKSLPRRKFEVIALMDSISHVRDLRGTLEELTQHHLADCGVLLIRTPDIRPSYFSTVSVLAKLVGARVASSLMHARARYVLFDSETLTRYLSSLGFDVLALQHVRDYPIALTSLRLAKIPEGIARRVLNMQNRSMVAIAARATRRGVSACHV